MDSGSGYLVDDNETNKTLKISRFLNNFLFNSKILYNTLITMSEAYT